MEGDRGNFVFAFHRAAVEGFDVFQKMDVSQIASIDFLRGKRVEHECIVRIRTVRNMDVFLLHKGE